MAAKDGTPANAGKKSRKLNYFYLDGELDGKTVPLLHKSLHINRGADNMIAWCYPLGKRVAYTYSHVKKVKEPAFTTIEVSKMLNRGRISLDRAILSGNIERPQHTYGLNEHRKMFQYLWHERNIVEAHQYYSTVHYGAPRKDGIVTPQRLPTLRELRAMIRQEQILYVRNDEGEFVPVWRAEDFT